MTRWPWGPLLHWPVATEYVSSLIGEVSWSDFHLVGGGRIWSRLEESRGILDSHGLRLYHPLGKLDSMGPGYIVSRFRVDLLIYSLEDLVGTTGHE